MQAGVLQPKVDIKLAPEAPTPEADKAVAQDSSSVGDEPLTDSQVAADMGKPDPTNTHYSKKKDHSARSKAHDTNNQHTRGESKERRDREEREYEEARNERADQSRGKKSKKEERSERRRQGEDKKTKK